MEKRITHENPTTLPSDLSSTAKHFSLDLLGEPFDSLLFARHTNTRSPFTILLNIYISLDLHSVPSASPAGITQIWEPWKWKGRWGGWRDPVCCLFPSCKRQLSSTPGIKLELLIIYDGHLYLLSFVGFGEIRMTVHPTISSILNETLNAVTFFAFFKRFFLKDYCLTLFNCVWL